LYKQKYNSGTPAPNRQDKQAGRKHPGKTPPPPRKPETPNRPQKQPEPVPSAPKGVLSRLLGVFNRKK